MKILKNKKARFGLVSLMAVFLEVVIFVIFLPQINTLIATALPYLENVMAQWLIKLLPLAIVIALTMGVFSKDDRQL